MTDRIEVDPSDGPWLNSVLQRVFAARRDGDQDEARRLLDYARAEGGAELGRVAELLAAADTARAKAIARGREMEPFGISLAPKGTLLCDFCAAPDPVVYYPVTEFEIAAPGGSWLSGDRFCACAACRRFVDGSDSPSDNAALACWRLWPGSSGIRPPIMVYRTGRDRRRYASHDGRSGT
ncbi:hypothetical protein SMC26_23165 [Actinomadura fulvescens]|uniref:Uncharacterized protein n=1 Tax=Actinomadura fulvescens TaxID=46160 RepID=A0ABN3QY23_9ACTN